MSFWRRGRKQTAAQKRERLLRDRINELEADVKAQQRIVRIQAVEIETLAAVIARDRERVKAEAATFARQRATQEGLTDG